DEAELGNLFYLLSQQNMTQQDVKEAFNVSLLGEVTI
ncbi:L-asparaginase 1, partial [Francisella tularensis subsp. holarctica]|nr:L-asparaginase 1 [Francisella tularensis subsp. holarctica]